jgi:glycine dehydrogenase subunit 1
MLASLGLSSFDDLYAHVPAEVHLDRPLEIPSGISEVELLDDLKALASKNHNVDETVCFAGGGAYDHYVPAVVWALAGRSELMTSYTPYQPELSQGVLQALFEYQSMICDITGMAVSNASLYDGPTALSEAVNMARAATGRERVLVSGTVDPRYLEVLRTYSQGVGYEPEVIGPRDGTIRAPRVGDDVACVILQHPNVYGALEPARRVFEAARASGARAVHIFDPLSLGVLAPPGELGADIAVAEGQSLGNHLNFGGPYLGIIAADEQDLRKMPGRIVGETLDVDGIPGYVLTLQTREQHIRREKATSNICTNQTLMAIAAAVYLAWLGPEGLRELGESCAAKARYASEACVRAGARLLHPKAPFFKEFALTFDRPAGDVRDALLDAGFLVGPVIDDGLIVACTERRTGEEIDGLAKALEEVLA